MTHLKQQHVTIHAVVKDIGALIWETIVGTCALFYKIST